MSQAPQPTTCYRHPDRVTGRSCTRCGRPACPDCLVQASVGSHCVDCVRAAAPSTGQRVRTFTRSQNMMATKTIVAITVAAYVAIGIHDSNFAGTGEWATKLGLYGPAVKHGDWWRIFTASLVHGGAMHIFFNMLLLWIIGQILEPGSGPLRFALIYVVSVAAGSAGALIVQPHDFVVGASGGVFGVAAAATLVMQRQGVRFWDTGFGPLLAINFVLDFFIKNVAVSAHIGGLIGGLLVAEAMMQARRMGRPQLGIAAAVAIGLAATVLCLAVAT